MLLNRQYKTITTSFFSAGELLLPQDLDWSLAFVSFLSRYPSDTDNQIYSNSETKNLRPHFISFVFVYCFIPDMPLKISNLDGLSLISSWKPCLFYRSFCYLQNIDFEGSPKSGLESLCFGYRYYQSDSATLQYSAIVGNWLIATAKFIARNAFSSSLVTVMFLPFWWE